MTGQYLKPKLPSKAEFKSDLVRAKIRKELRESRKHNGYLWRKFELVRALNRNPRFHLRATMGLTDI